MTSKLLLYSSIFFLANCSYAEEPHASNVGNSSQDKSLPMLQSLEYGYRIKIGKYLNECSALTDEEKQQKLVREILNKIKTYRNCPGHDEAAGCELLEELYLIYGKHPDIRAELLQGMRELAQKLTPPSESEFAVAVHFSAADAGFEALTAELFKHSNYNPNASVDGYRLLAWSLLADSPFLMDLLLKRGANAKINAVCGYWITPARYYNNAGTLSPTFIGILMDSHCLIREPEFRNYGSGAPNLRLVLPHLLYCRQRTNGITLAKQLLQHGCKIVHTGSTKIMLVHLLATPNISLQKENNNYHFQDKWSELYSYIIEQENIQLEQNNYNDSYERIPLIMSASNPVSSSLE